MKYPVPFKRQRPDGGYYPRYYIRFECRGRDYLFSTKTADEKLARVRSKEYYDSVVGGSFHMAASMKSRSAVPSFDQIFEAYLKLPLPVSQASRKKNINCAKLVLKSAKLSTADRVDQLSESMVIGFQQQSLADGLSVNTINSRLRTMRSLFSRRAMTAYRGISMDIHEQWVRPFMQVSCLKARGMEVKLPDDSLIAAAHRELPATPDLYRCFLLAAFGGMRSGEIMAARWSWFRDNVIYIGADGDFTPKSGISRAVALDPAIVAKIHQGDKSSLFIAGSTPKMTVGRLLVPVLRKIGFSGMNPLHSLRRWAGSNIAATQGIYAAQKMLGHADPTITAKHYLRQINLAEPVPANTGMGRQTG